MKEFRLVIGIALCLLFGTAQLYAQKAVVSGKVTDDKNRPLAFAHVAIEGSSGGSVCDEKGRFELSIPAGKSVIVFASFTGYKKSGKPITLEEGQRAIINFRLSKTEVKLPEAVIVGRQNPDLGMEEIDPKAAFVIPTPSGSIESLIKTELGVSSNNELSSQYNVRGGNYDENLVYVNGIEIYRPFLVRSGEQEGLSFLNPDLVEKINFSAGGFDAKYGDKMASVLDIKYKRPESFGGSVTMGLLGFAVHLEDFFGKDTSFKKTDSTEKKGFSYMLGVRQKSNQYLLSALDTKGEYKPSFTDVQAMIRYNNGKKWDLSFLGNYARNKYMLVPESRETRFGNINEALKLKIYFDGQEVDRFETMFGAFNATFRPNKKMAYQFIASAFNTNESETFDINGEYYIYQLEADFGKEDFGEELFERGVGAFLNHARNYLQARVLTFEHKGSRKVAGRELLWGVSYRNEDVYDKLNEWRLVDSAGYTLPRPMDSVGYQNPAIQPYYDLMLQDVVRTQINLNTNRINGYVQHNWVFEKDQSRERLFISAGARFSYWDLNKDFLFSPRAKIGYQPNWRDDVVFHFATGYYYQPPFYREIRDLYGEIHPDVKAQKSIHFVLGSEWKFKGWGRPFQFTGEIYYKYLDDLIPYEVDNVRIRYYAENLSRGYATGIDLKVIGEFVEGIDSWVTLSVMQTQEDIKNDFYYKRFNSDGELIIPGYSYNNVAVDSVRIEPGYIPRPTDQRVNFSLFFQDFLPKNPTYKMHLNLVFGSSLPFGPPSFERYKDTLRIPAYRRVDIGFSKQLMDESTTFKNEKNPFRHFKDIWVTVEVFNLLQISNTVSYIWVTDVTNRSYAVPNYLTPRQLNVRLIARF